ncbi:MAG: single-stranded-DNA-specific exonuclease RecJ [Clostridia bacterium]|nr:single-stranded-DNA-specific exonuclease RecJ [Clostridia bacterium]
MKFKQRNEKEPDIKDIKSLAKELSLSEITARILLMRGYTDADSAREYLGLNGIKFSNPYDIAGVSEAVDGIKKAMSENARITIYSDYDADGVCGCSIFLNKFKELGYDNVNYYVPDREGEGYGLNRDALDRLQNNGTGLVITVDCGISNIEEISHANSVGLDMIVTDHHNCPPSLPDCILVNPKLGCANGQENLCGAAVAMKVCQALGGGSAFKEGMELAAIATVADMMPLVGENKHIVNEGLLLMNNKPSHEIKMLIKAAVGKDIIDSDDIAFKLGPVINAAGRVSSAHIGVELLSGRSKSPLEDALQMTAHNDERKNIQAGVYSEALHMLTADDLKSQHAIVLYNKDWPIGVIGIAASKLMKAFGMPVALLGESDGVIKGSLRSVEGINIFDVLCEMEELFQSFGGHSKAAGITLHDGKYNEFKERFQSSMQSYSKDLFDNTLYYDTVCSADEVTLDLIHEFSYMKPFGQGNPSVKLLLKNMKATEYKTMGKDNNHYRASFKDSTGQVNCVGFFSSLRSALSGGSMVCDVMIEPSENIWNGHSSVQGLIEGIHGRFEKFSDYTDYISSINSDFISSSVQAALAHGNSGYRISSFDDIKASIEESDYSTLIIAEDAQSAQRITGELGSEILSKLIISTNTLDVSAMGRNSLLLAPHLDKLKSKWYSNIYYVSSYNHVNTAESLAKSLHHDIQMVIMDSIYKDKLISKERLREIYSIIKHAVNNSPVVSLLDICGDLKISRSEMLIAIDIFTETGLLKRENKEFAVSTETTKDIEESRGYKLFALGIE